MRKSKAVPPASTVGPSTAPAAPAPKSLPNPMEARIHCRRVDALYTTAQHRACPYCFGGEGDVLKGDHAAFCDFKPGQDPVVFGFPDDQGRYSWM